MLVSSLCFATRQSLHRMFMNEYVILWGFQYLAEMILVQCVLSLPVVLVHLMQLPQHLIVHVFQSQFRVIIISFVVIQNYLSLNLI